MEHPYIKYAVALIMEKCGYQSIDDITNEDIINEIEAGLNTFCLKYDKIQDGYATFDYTDKEPNWAKNKLDNISNVILSPHIITSNVKGLYDKISLVKNNVRTNDGNTGTLYASIMPTAKKVLQLTGKGNISRQDTRLFNKDIAYILITTLTPNKPCSSKWVNKGKKDVSVNTCIIPDISIEATKDFVALFSRLQKQKTEGLFKGKMKNKEKKNEVERPLIYSGNYPNAAKSMYLQSLSVLGYIGELAKDGDYSLKARKVLGELEMNPVIFVDSTPDSESASIIHYSHFIIEIAKERSLHKIIDSLYYARFYKYKGLKRNEKESLYKAYTIDEKEKDIEYEKFDYYTSKFLTLFNRYSFNEFLSCRVEYPSEIRTILIIYFNKMEQISKVIIESAESLGAWINRSAFNAALSDEAPGKSWSEVKENEKIKRNIEEKKYKFLTSLESSVFSATDNTSMIANIIAQVGRLSNSDAPDTAVPFIKAVMEPTITLPAAKNLLIAFSRVYSPGAPSDSINNGNTNSNNTFDSTNL